MCRQAKADLENFRDPPPPLPGMSPFPCNGSGLVARTVDASALWQSCLQPLPLPLSPPQWPSFSNVLPRSQCCVLALLVDLLKPRKGPHEGEAGGALRILQVSSPKQTCGRAESDLGDWNPPFHPGLCPPCDPGQFLPLSFLIPSCPRRG